jgi:hypothetical protein
MNFRLSVDKCAGTRSTSPAFFYASLPNPTPALVSILSP